MPLYGTVQLIDIGFPNQYITYLAFRDMIDLLCLREKNSGVPE